MDSRRLIKLNRVGSRDGLAVELNFFRDETSFSTLLFVIFSDAKTNSYWPVISWAIGGGCFSLLILPLMEDYGVQKVCLATYVGFLSFMALKW